MDKDYSDPAWDDLISQIAYGDMLNLIYNGSYQTQVLPAINLPATQEFDGPTGFTKSMVGGSNGMAFTSEDVMAATYNLELIQEVGKCMGEDMLHAQSGDNAAAVAGIYAPVSTSTEAPIWVVTTNTIPRTAGCPAKSAPRRSKDCMTGVCRRS